MTRPEFDSLSFTEIGCLRRQWQAKQRREDYRAGVLASLIANVNRDSKTRPTPFQPADFFETIPRRTTRPPIEEVIRKLNQAMQAYQATG